MKIKMPTGIVRGLKSRIDGLVHDWHSSDDEILYSLVADEIEQDNIHKGLWLKAMAQADMDEAKAKAVYVKLRTASVRKVLVELAKARGLATEVLSELTRKAKELENLVSAEQDATEKLAKLRRERKEAENRLSERRTEFEKIRQKYVASQKNANQRFSRFFVAITFLIVIGIPALGYFLTPPDSHVLANAEEFGFWVYNFRNGHFVLSVVFGWIAAALVSIPLSKTSGHIAVTEQWSKSKSKLTSMEGEIGVLDQLIFVAESQSNHLTGQMKLLSSDIDELQSTIDDALNI